MEWEKRETLWIFISGVVLLAVLVFLFWGSLLPEYSGYQAEFRDIVRDNAGQQGSEAVPSGIQQIWVAALGRTDRCPTCHLGMSWKGLEREPNPYRSHPVKILEKHPLAEFGCTVCHGGQGYGTTEESAHATQEFNWEEPLLGKELGELYLISDRAALEQIHCNSCHRYDRKTDGAAYINSAKELVHQKGCRSCHKINGRGGVIGPDLMFEGDQNPEQFDYSRLSGVPSVFSWHVGHFKDPKSMVATTVMPNFGFGSREAQALSMLVMSWRRQTFPIRYLPGVQLADLPTPEEAEKEKQMLTGPGAFFVRKGCFICHDVTAFGVESAAKLGPDLSVAYSDVQSRFGRTLEDFLAAPTGTMAVVLSTQIHLTDAERTEAIGLLKEAYQKHLQNQEAQIAGTKR